MASSIISIDIGGLGQLAKASTRCPGGLAAVAELGMADLLAKIV